MSCLSGNGKLPNVRGRICIVLPLPMSRGVESEEHPPGGSTTLRFGSTPTRTIVSEQ